MLLQNIRARIAARLNGDSEAGFTLIELLVVMLILGILAAIALPAFFNQKEKATDAQAKSFAHSAQVAIETYSTENGGSYLGATEATLKKIEPTLNGVKALTLTPAATEKTYTVTVESETGNKFSVSREAAGTTKLSCTTEENGGCPKGGNWGK
jgi:type IV pilus assembly protein PilA